MRSSTEPERRRRDLPARVALATALLLAACSGSSQYDAQKGSGTVGPGRSPDPAPVTCEAGGPVDPGPAPLRRLTHREYDNTVLDLFGPALLGPLTAPSSTFPPEGTLNGFRNHAAALTVTPRLTEAYLQAAEAVSLQVTSNLPALLECDPVVSGEETCARRFLLRLGERAWRRPLAPDEEERLWALYSATRAAYPYRAGIRLLIQAVLQSPRFLYRIESGALVAGGGAVPLDGWDLATRLAYFLWQSAPDPTLLEAARAGTLQRPEEVAAQARRLLADPRGRHRRTSDDFHAQWLGLERLDSLEKDAVQYPEFAAARALLRKETEHFIDQVLWVERASLQTLFTAPYTFWNGPLAAYYGAQGPTGEAFSRTSLPAGRSAGIFSQAGLLAVNANATETNPVRRGLLVREQLLCSPPPPPPDDVDLEPPDPAPGLTTRERFAVHRENPVCGSCHQLMDPIGLSLEHFDASGRWRDTDQGEPVDATGELVQTDVDGVFSGAGGLGERLAASRQVGRCVATQWFRFAHGRDETAAEACVLDVLEREVSSSGGTLEALLVALTQTDAFLYRPATGASP